MPSSTSIYSKEPTDILEAASVPLAETDPHSDLRSDTPARAANITLDAESSLGFQLSFAYDKPASLRSDQAIRELVGIVFDDTGARVHRPALSEADQPIQ